MGCVFILKIVLISFGIPSEIKQGNHSNSPKPFLSGVSDQYKPNSTVAISTEPLSSLSEFFEEVEDENLEFYSINDLERDSNSLLGSLFKAHAQKFFQSFCYFSSYTERLHLRIGVFRI
jgi:hypothetical protein